MTLYGERRFTYRPILIRENPAAFAAYGLDPELTVASTGDDAVAVVVVELDIIETILPSMDEFDARFEPVVE